MNGPCTTAKLKLPTGLWCGRAPNSCLNTSLKLFRQNGSKTETQCKWMNSTLTVAALLTCSIMIALYASVWTVILMLCSRLMPHSLGYLLGCRRDCSLPCGPRFKKHMRQWVGLVDWRRSFIYTFSVLTNFFTQSCASYLVEVSERKVHQCFSSFCHSVRNKAEDWGIFFALDGVRDHLPSDVQWIQAVTNHRTLKKESSGRF